MCISEAREFLTLLFRKVEGEQCLTLTAIHPDRDRASPSRHIPVGNAAMDNTLEQLMVTNTEHGYGAYIGVATRRVGLSRWQRGGLSEVVSLPALFVDIDREPRDALADLKRFPLSPSVLVLSGFGVHAYWLLKEPLKENIARANQLLVALAKRLHGDPLTVAQCMCMLRGISLRWMETSTETEGAGSCPLRGKRQNWVAKKTGSLSATR